MAGPGEGVDPIWLEDLHVDRTPDMRVNDARLAPLSDQHIGSLGGIGERGRKTPDHQLARKRPNASERELGLRSSLGREELVPLVDDDRQAASKERRRISSRTEHGERLRRGHQNIRQAAPMSCLGSLVGISGLKGDVDPIGNRGSGLLQRGGDVSCERAQRRHIHDAKTGPRVFRNLMKQTERRRISLA